MEIKMNYEEMERMIQACKGAEDQLEEVISQVIHITEEINGGALLGTGGTAYYDALQEVLKPKLQKLRNKFVELQGDLRQAVSSMKSADSETAGEMGM